MKKLFKIALLFCMFTILLSSCKKEPIDDNKYTVDEIQSKPIVNNVKSTSTWSYYTVAVPVQINHSITPGTFMLEVGNTGNRIATVSVYPKNGTNVDYGNRITIFTVDINLGYCVIKTLSLPSGYDGILITLSKNSPTGGYIGGTVSVTK